MILSPRIIDVLLIDPYNDVIVEHTIHNDVAVIKRMLDASCTKLYPIDLGDGNRLYINGTPISLVRIEDVRSRGFSLPGGHMFYGRSLITGWDDDLEFNQSCSISVARLRESVKFYKDPMVGHA